MGFWRRYRFVLLAVAFLLAALTLFSLSAGRRVGGGPVEQVLLELAGPVQEQVSRLGRTVAGVWNSYFALVHTAKKNRELKERLEVMQRELVELGELRRANRRLRALLGLKQKTGYPMVAAEVVGLDPSNHFRSVVINKGSADGLSPPMPVVHAQGAVGRLIWTSPHYAKVLLLTDPNCGVDVLVQRSRARGILEGAGRDRLRLKYVQQNLDVLPGDLLITSGAAGVFPKGILVGQVLTVLKKGKGAFMEVTVKPAVDFEHLEEVLVILRHRDIEG